MERVLLSLAAKEEELAVLKRSDNKWCREVEMWEKMIGGLKTSNSKKSAKIGKLKEDLGHLEHELLERNDRIKYLSEEVAVEKQERTDAQEQAQSNRWATESLQAELKEEQTAHQKLREESIQAALEAEQQRESFVAEIQSLLVCLAFLESEAHRFDIIEGYRQRTFGKVEVAPAYKTGYDFLEAQLPTELRSDPNQFHYPSRVVNCLDVLLEIEK